MRELQRQLPDSANVQLQTAGVQQAAGHPKEALAAYERAISLDPGMVAAYLGRGDLYLALGQRAKAAGDYRSALQLTPEDVAALNNLAWILSTSPEAELRDGRRAVELAAAACRATEHRRAELLGTLAAAHAEAGDFSAAVEWAQKAIQTAEPPLKEELEDQLQAYQMRRPWRDVPAP